MGTSFKVRLQAVRAPFFTASVIPVLFAAAYALWHGDPLSWPLTLMTAAGVVCLQAGTNCINDYYDFKKGVDRKDTYGSSRVLVDGLMTPRQVYQEGMALFALGAVLGLGVAFLRGWPVVGLGLVGLAGGYLYSGKPWGLKYLALGDVMVFMLMGPFLVFGAFYALTGVYSLPAAAASLPIGYLVTAIVHANNIRDIRYDTGAGIRTLAIVLGLSGAKAEYYLLLAAAYVSVALMAVLGALPLYTLVVFLSLPLALANIRTVAAAREDDLGTLAAMDIRTAQLHLLFGLLFITAIGVGAIQ